MELKRGLGIDLWTRVKYQSQQENFFETSNFTTLVNKFYFIPPKNSLKNVVQQNKSNHGPPQLQIILGHSTSTTKMLFFIYFKLQRRRRISS